MLAKPGIIFGNLLAGIAGFLLASKGNIHFSLFISLAVGMSLVIGSACVLNNYIDRNTDKKMDRTQKRSLATGAINANIALLYGVLLGMTGFFILAHFTNLVTFLLGFIGYCDYLIFYGLAKRHTVHSTIIGCISGAMPPVAGYTAVTGRIDIAAVMLFLILVFWQMPHFYAIAIYRIKDYAAANLYVWPVRRGVESTKIYMTLYITAFFLATLSLFFLGYTGYIYLTIMLLLGGTWLVKSFQGFHTTNTDAWARGMFSFSLLALMVVCITISLHGVFSFV